MLVDRKHSVFCILAMVSCFSNATAFALSSYPLSSQYSGYRTTSEDNNNNNINYNNKVLVTKRYRNQHSSPTTSSGIVKVDDFIENGDHTMGFNKAWAKACSATRDVAFMVPRGKSYLVKQLTFSGPCVSQITMQIEGTIEASSDMSDFEDSRNQWILFEKVHELTVLGGGTVNGNGAIWWRNSCKTDPSKPCVDAPTAMLFSGCKNLVVREITLRNAQQMHLTFDRCVNVRASNLVISSPGDSPNTDGIHVAASTNVIIQKSVIGTGDDCISIVSGSTNVKAIDITCGPGHGISIGSLGKGRSEARVSNVLVNRATLSGTMNGVRIKSWQGGSGYAEGITFQNVMMHNVSNPIIIDQNYCDQTQPCPTQRSAVRVNNVRYSNIRGTSSTDVAIKFDCSNSYPCREITLEDVSLAKEGGDVAQAACKNILLKRLGRVHPHC